MITGETGAGKSLLIDALGLAIGARADSSLVRHGAESARVEALFDRLPEPLIAAREVAAGGRSTARLDDDTVTAARLAEEVGPLVEIHGQHDQQHLLDERWQRDLLDGFGGHAELRGAVAAAVARVAGEPDRPRRAHGRPARARPTTGAARVRGERDRRGAPAARRSRRDPRPARRRPARRGDRPGCRRGPRGADRRRRGARGGRRRRPRGAGDRPARRAVRGLAERLAGLEAELEDAAAESRTLAEAIDHDPAALAALEERLGVIYGLERRYGADEAAVIAHGERAAAEAERLQGVDGERARREADDARLLGSVGAAAAALSSARVDAAATLSAAVGHVLVELGFPAGVFEVALGRRTAGSGEAAVEVDGDAVAFDAAGIDQVVYRLAPNAGEPFRPLARIASGGELSRVALAIKQVLAEADDTPTLVFDEVDTGIGGRSADPVGRSLWTLARRHQVLCVTHLPQIAAHADAQFRISKRERDGRTVTEVERLDREGRIVELAQMLGSGSGAAAGLAAARELLDRAEAWRGASATAG